MHYIKQLDSVRAIAVILVIITHWVPETHALNVYTGVFNGVDIFFVLSGFLITRILLETRMEAEKLGTPKITLVKNFFTRRFLRIFPIYYLTVFLLFVAGPATGTDIRGNFLYFLTYTANFYFFDRQEWDGMLSHLWSLSVEEQFYLIWPWFMLFLHKKSLLPLILLSVLTGIAAQLLLMEVSFGDILTFSCFDGFGLGALLAWVVVFRPGSLGRLYPAALCLAVISCLLQVMRVAGSEGIVLLPSRTLTAIFTLWVIIGILLYGEKKSIFFNSILSNRALIFVGKISYGLYLYHLIIPYVTWRAFDRMNSYLPSAIYRYNEYLVQVENLGLLLLISYISWVVIEKPILRLKRYFEYQQTPAVAPPKAVAS